MPTDKTLRSATYLPQGYRERFFREMAEVDPRTGRTGWHDEDWDGAVHATARPLPVVVALHPSKARSKAQLAAQVMRQLLTDPPDVAAKTLKATETERTMLLETQHRQIGRRDGQK